MIASDTIASGPWQTLDILVSTECTFSATYFHQLRNTSSDGNIEKFFQKSSHGSCFQELEHYCNYIAVQYLPYFRMPPLHTLAHKVRAHSLAATVNIGNLIIIRRNYVI